MKSHSLRWLFWLGCFAAWVVLSPTAFAQSKEIDHIGNELAKECMKARPPLLIVAVADLRDTDGTNNDQGHFMSLILTQAISLHIKDGFAIAEHNGFDDALKSRAISAEALTTPKSTNVIAGRVNLTAVVIGDFRNEPNDYSLHLSVIRVYDGTVVYSSDVKFRHNDFLDSLAKPFPPPEIHQLFKLKTDPTPAEKEALRPPVCVHCRVPQYTNVARNAKLQGTVVFETVISDQGEVVALRPKKLLGLGLDEAAYDIIKNQWRMKPGTKDGKPIGTVVPIEVSFRLY